MTTPADEGIAAARADVAGERMIIGRFEIGDSAHYQDSGAVCVQHVHDCFYRVFVTGGALPDDDTEKGFPTAGLAFAYAAEVVAEIVEEYTDFVDSYGVQP